MRTRKQLKTTAYHEAGHAVIARVLTLDCGHASIKPDYDEGTAGVAIIVVAYTCDCEWDKRGKIRTPDAAWHALIISSMAGAEAEMELLGSKAIGDGDDRLRIARMADELGPFSPDWDKLEPRRRAFTRTLVRRHRAKIERVAKALLTKTTLSAKALDKLVGRSIDDVKANAPLLMSRQPTCRN